ncbi:MAG: GNAT family protein [Acidimicrobiia bacterium]|nr:GNAT family protein [Acidimicrobiia bacterium]
MDTGADFRLSRGDIVVRAPTRGDLPQLREVFSHPGVTRWWPEASEEELVGRVEGSDPDVVGLVVEASGAVVGFVQWYEETDPEYRHAGIDIALHPDVHGRGIGSTTIRMLAEWLVTDRGHHRVVIDPAAHNEQAIAAYRKAGFRPVGVMRQYWWDHVEGRWTDGLLMDALASELQVSD